eukprot:TRINITY_DN20801_c0_g1_i1.p1 TRINITY_DN20801_c0_g1~~TRINITY_DN20801_c0_g1_i1.p1  ORF type:complete len:156 (-),score=50.58 TRINITY_DN20801_c0_g1_i1:384-851(-)
MLRSLVGSEMCIRDSINAEYGDTSSVAMDRGFSDQEFMAKLEKYPMVRPRDFIATQRRESETQTAPARNASPASSIKAAAAEAPGASSTGALCVEKSGTSEQFWTALQAAIGAEAGDGQARRLVASMKSRHHRNITSMSLDQMNRMAAQILSLCS